MNELNEALKRYEPRAIEERAAKATPGPWYLVEESLAPGKSVFEICAADGKKIEVKPTHWQPLPQPPAAKGEK